MRFMPPDDDYRFEHPDDGDGTDDDAQMLMECTTCDGDGYLFDGDGEIPCPECDGEGWV